MTAHQESDQHQPQRRNHRSKMSIEDRQKKLRMVQEVYNKWSPKNPPVDDEYLATDEQEAELIKLINEKLNQVE
jgi:UDP-glucose 6-dehydrogenase